MSWILKDTVNGTKIYQWDTNYATRNLAGSGQMSKEVMNDKNPVAHDPDGGTQGNAGAKDYAESIVNKLKNYEYVIGTQASCGTDSAYIAIPLDYSIPHCGNFEWNNSTWGAEKYGEDSKENCKKANKVFYDLSVYANKKYGSKIGAGKLHNELSATACPAKSIQFFGSNQAVKDDINSNANDVKYYFEKTKDDEKSRYYNPASKYSFRAKNSTYIFKSKNLSDKYQNTKKVEVGETFGGLTYDGTTVDDGYKYYWEKGKNQYGNVYYIVYKKVKI